MFRKKIIQKKNFLIIFLIVLFLVFLFFYRSAAAPLVFNAIGPFTAVKDFFSDFGSDILIKFDDAERLSADNSVLRNRVRKLEAELATLKNSEDGINYEYPDNILAFVLSFPPSAPFDSLVINKGENDGIKNGMKAILSGGIFVGFISDIYPSYSRIKLLSYFDDSHQVFLDGNSGAVIISGMGAGTVLFEFPRDFPVKEGSKFFIPSKGLLYAGFIEKIKRNDSNPVISAVGVLPFNLNQLKEVFIIP